MRIGFAGTPAFAAMALEALLDAGLMPHLVLTQPDRPAGRGLRPTPSVVKQRALAHGLCVAQPASLRLNVNGHAAAGQAEAASTQALLQAASLDVLVVVAYGLILPQWVLDLPRLGCLNIHASLLPRWRGAAPIQRAIEAGDAQSGVSIMQMEAGLDTGAVLWQEALPIALEETSASLHDKLALLGGRLVVQTLHALATNPLAVQAQAQPQDHSAATYAHKISKAEAQIDWSQGAQAIARKIRALNPAPGCTAVLGWVDEAGVEKVETLKLWSAYAAQGVWAQADQVRQGEPTLGQVLGVDERGLRFWAGDGEVIVTQLQRAGGKRMDAQHFARGAQHLHVAQAKDLGALPASPKEG